jgi:hypothetical protein
LVAAAKIKRTPKKASNAENDKNKETKRMTARVTIKEKNDTSSSLNKTLKTPKTPKTVKSNSKDKNTSKSKTIDVRICISILNNKDYNIVTNFQIYKYNFRTILLEVM